MQDTQTPLALQRRLDPSSSTERSTLHRAQAAPVASASDAHRDARRSSAPRVAGFVRSARRRGSLRLAGALVLQSLATAAGHGEAPAAAGRVSLDGAPSALEGTLTGAPWARLDLADALESDPGRGLPKLRLAWIPGECGPGGATGPQGAARRAVGASVGEPDSMVQATGGALLLAGLGEGDRFHVLWETPGCGPVRLLSGVASEGAIPRIELPGLEGVLTLVRSAGTGSGPGVARLTLPARQLPQGSGEILITEFLRDPVAVSDAFGEWFEVYNSTNQPIDVEGWSLTDEGSDATVLDNAGLGIVVPPRGYLVLGREVSPAFNGGALVHAEYQGFTLANSSDEIVLRRPGGRLVDRVAYDSSAGWPGAPGASAELAQGRLGSTWNDDPAMWCTATSRMTGGDLGSPGVGNGPCP